MSAHTGPPCVSSIFAVLAGETATTSAVPQTAARAMSFLMLLLLFELEVGLPSRVVAQQDVEDVAALRGGRRPVVDPLRPVEPQARAAGRHGLERVLRVARERAARDGLELRVLDQ